MGYRKWISVGLVGLICALAATALWEETGQEPMVAQLNQEISSHDVSMVLKNIFLHPNERSLYGPGDTNYGMPVKDEYGKGPIVVFNIEKKPEYIDKLGYTGGSDWYEIELFSDGKPLSRGTSSEGVAGFSFWISGADEELVELGQVECKIKLGTVVKVGDISLEDLERGAQPLFQDEDVSIWDVKWQTETLAYDGDPFTRVHIGLERKKDIMKFAVVFKGADPDKEYLPTNSSLGEKRVSFGYSIEKNKIKGVELWKIIPVIEKTFPARFVPQKDIIRD